MLETGAPNVIQERFHIIIHQKEVLDDFHLHLHYSYILIISR